MVALKVLFALLPLLASMALETNASPLNREVPQGMSYLFQSWIQADKSREISSEVRYGHSEVIAVEQPV
jgi:hypothetical protein